MSNKVKENTEIDEKLRATLTILDGSEKGLKVRLFKKKNTIGRDKGDIVLADTKVSGVHASIEVKDSDFYVYDLESTNGTFVNNRRIKESILRDGDTIQIGTVNIIFSVNAVSENTDEVGFKDQTRGWTKAREATEKDGISRIIDRELAILQTKSQASKNEEKPAGKKKKTGISLFLQVIDGNDKGEKFKFTKGSMVIGRVSVDIKLKDTDVSRKHAIVEAFGKNEIFIRDLASTNGTFVNGKKIANCKLNEGDEVVIGTTVMKFLVEEE